MTSLDPTRAERNRETAAVGIVAAHLSRRAEHHISGRIIEGGLTVWTVKSQTDDKEYTVVRQADGWPCDCCDCPDHLWRHLRCKHLRSVDMLMGDATPTPTPAPAAPSQADDRAARDALSAQLEERNRQERRARRPRERVEEV